MSRSPSPAPAGSDNAGVGLDKASLHGPDFEADKRRVKEMKWDLPDVVADTAPVGFGHEAVRYEFTGELGETAPRNEALEMELFFNPNRTTMGENMEKLKYKVVVEGTFQPEVFMTFEDAGLHPVVADNVDLCGYRQPTPIQSRIVPVILSGYDVVATAQTGSGKTAAYLIPIISKICGKVKTLCAPRPHPATYDPARDAVRAEPLVLVVCPSRELAIQIFEEARRLCYRTMLRPAVVYGGAPPRSQVEELQKGCDILIATPGRLIDFMNRANILTLSRVKWTVIDEADEMLHADWEEDFKQILSGGDSNEDADHSYLFFSATFPKIMRKVAKEFLAEDYIRVRIGRIGSTHQNIKQNIVWVDDSEKRRAVVDLLFSLKPARTLIFCNSKKTVELLDDFLYAMDFPTTSLHSDRIQKEREDSLRAFRVGTCPIMVATGVLARGIDVNHIMHVINFDLPSGQHGGIQEYVHRIGRTARIGNEGLATSFYNDRNEDIAEELTKLLVESKQEVPEFLASYAPEEGENINFNDDTSESGSGSDTEPTNEAPAEAETGFIADPPADTGFTGDDSNNNDDAAW